MHTHSCVSCACPYALRAPTPALCDPCARGCWAGSTATAQGAAASTPTNAPDSAGSVHGEAAATHTPTPPKHTRVQQQTSTKASEVPLEQLVDIVPGPPPQEEQVVCMCVCVSPCLCLHSSCVCHTHHVNDAHTHVRRVLWRRVLQAARHLLRCRLPSPHSTPRIRGRCPCPRPKRLRRRQPSPHSTSRMRRRCLCPRRRRHCMPARPNRRRWSQAQTHGCKRPAKSANSPTVHLLAQQSSPRIRQELLGLRQKAAATMRARREGMRAQLTSRRRTQMHSTWMKCLWRPSLSSCMVARHLGSRRSGRETRPREAVEAPGRRRLVKNGLRAKAKANLPWWRLRAPALTRL